MFFNAKLIFIVFKFSSLKADGSFSVFKKSASIFIRKISKKGGAFKFLALFCLVLSCRGQQEEPIKHFRLPSIFKEPDLICQDEGQPFCWQFSSCRNFCKTLFPSEEKREVCHNWPASVAIAFEDMFKVITEGAFEYINPQTVKCFLKLNDKSNHLFFKNLDIERAKAFLKQIAFEPHLAYQIASEDKGDFSFLTALFKKIKNRVMSAIKQPLQRDGKNFPILIHEADNRQAWIWLNDYLIHYCRQKIGRKLLDCYCELLQDVENSILKNFFENEQFKRAHKEDIESRTCGSVQCEYGNPFDFKRLCDSI